MECLFKPGDWCILLSGVNFSTHWKAGKTFLVERISLKMSIKSEKVWFLYDAFSLPANIYASYCRLATKEEILLELEQLIEKEK